jgi:signal recognition particle subunit SRP54
MMGQMARGGFPGMPGMPGVGGQRRQAKQQKQAKGKRRSGNPMKRKQEELEAARRREERAASPFGVPAQDGATADPSDFELPKGFEQFLK